MAKAIMIQGTMSNAGKSLLAAGLCRIFKQDGYRVAPFKSQNMALNSCITQEGLEIGRAQAVQAEAAGIKPAADMNPILLKPTSDMGSQVIVQGIPQGNMTAREYFAYKKSLVSQIKESYQRLAAKYDIIVIEGAGSPAEINLKQDDIVNMGMAKLAKAPVLLAGDIDRGGVFAQLYGTVALLDPEERSYIKGFIVNKFRGDKSLLDPGIAMLKNFCNIPAIGVVPYMDVTIEDEDSLSGFLEEGKEEGKEAHITIGVIRFPRISNFTDFAVFSSIPGVKVRFVSGPEELGCPDMVILPGTKNTIKDLLWMRQNGLEAAVLKLAARQIPIWGICGGYQMLGEELKDPEGVEYSEGTEGPVRGMGLLPLKTVFEKEKTRTLVTGSLGELDGIFADLTGHNVEGYEIHMGRTTINREEGIIDTARIVNGIPEICRPTAYLMERQDGGRLAGKQAKTDGYSRGNVYGAYVHGIFDAEGVAPAIVKALASERGIDLAQEPENFDYKAFRESQYEKLAAILRENLDMEAIYRILEEGIDSKEQAETKNPETKPEPIAPAEIEAKSFAIISRELDEKGYLVKPEEELILKRVIHTTADFDYAENLMFSPKAVKDGLRALGQGGVIITDTQMAWSGINKRKLKELGGEALCFMADADVAEAAKQKGITRAAASMDKAAAMFGENWGPVIVAVGNAPTALIRLSELIKEGKLRPSLIIAVPVGFVNVVPAKEQILTLKDIPFIVARGRKGGSNVAAAICNALLYQL